MDGSVSGVVGLVEKWDEWVCDEGMCEEAVFDGLIGQ